MSDKRDGGNDGTRLDPELAEATRNQKHISLLEAATLPSKEFTPPTLSKTAPSETPLTNGFPTRVVERAIQEALHPIGMSTHSGKVTLDISHVQRIIARSRQIETALAESRAECERLREQVYVPGVWKCAKCKLELMTSILAVSSGSIHANNSPQVCPNNCGPMWRMTERDQRKEAQALHEKEFLRAQAAETREREAYERAAKDVAAKQAKIDALMLEYCPNEMTENQIATWKDAQVVVPQETEDAINRALSGERREG